VFLLQGLGKRLWRVSEQQDLTLIEGAPLRILQNFTIEQEWLLEPGDMLYLPPHAAHWGIAVGDCMTYSIGFRAPSMHELATQFFAYLEEHLSISGIYADPDLKLQKHPARISADMVTRVTRKLKKIQWGESDVANFLGSYLSEPKAHVVFDTHPAMDIAKFQLRMENEGIALRLKSRALFYEENFYINGEQIDMPTGYAGLLKLLADQRRITAENLVIHKLDEQGSTENNWVDVFYQWYRSGYICFL
jgi:50S ribosomal protein L16 3-hydroxylase